MAVCAIWSITSSAWYARRCGNAKYSGASRRISSGRCALSCRMRAACDHLGGRKRLPASRGINLARHAGGKPLADTYKRGFIYSDCWAQDARLVVLNAMDARQHGATIMPRTRCVSANRAHGQWQVTLQPVPCGEPCRISAAALVNAAGPWVARTIEDTARMGTSYNSQLGKGRHIILLQ